MTQAELPVLVAINARRALWIGIGLFLMGLVSLGIAALIYGIGADMSLLVVALPCFAVFAPLGAYFIGVSIAKPVALRMDHQGISGFYAEPASWHDIKRVGQWESDDGDSIHLGFELHNPTQFFDQQTAWRRLTTWSNARSVGFHITVPSTLLSGPDVARLVEIGRDLHQRATQNPTGL